GAGVGTLVLEDVLLGRVPPRSAELPGPVRRAPALAGQRAVPAQKVVAREVLAAQHLVADLAGEMGVEEAANLGPEALLIGGVAEVHAGGVNRFGTWTNRWEVKNDRPVVRTRCRCSCASRQRTRLRATRRARSASTGCSTR